MENPNNQNEVQRSLGRIEGGLGEIKTEIGLIRTDHAGLRAEFNKLEAGRLTRLEGAFAILESQTKYKAKNTALWVSGVMTIAISLLSALLNHYLHL